MNRELRQALESSPKGREFLAAQDKAKRERRARSKALGRRGRAPGPTREERRAAADARELAGKAAARVRSGGRCEWHEGGRRCGDTGTERDHVLGGRWKKEMEALPNGEGLQDLCHDHHQVVKHGPDRLGALRQAKEHAIRIRSRGPLRHVEDAIARYHARHPEGR